VSANTHVILVMTIEIGGVGQLHRNVTIGTLPDYVLLEIFSFYTDESYFIETWIILVHVCQRWRNIVFASPRRLNLQLLCDDSRPVRDLLDIWPALPISISDSERMMWYSKIAEDNLIAAFEHKDRICNIFLSNIQSSIWESISYCLEGSFPMLESLDLSSPHDLEWDWEQEQDINIPDSFLGGSAPNLKSLYLYGIPCPPIPPLLLSASGLVRLNLSQIPYSGDIPPGTMATCLSTLTKLQAFTLQLPSPVSPPSSPRSTSQHLPPATRTVLPFLSQFQFEGPSEYLEVLMAHITAPLLRDFWITIDGNVPILAISQVSQFISRVEQFRALNQASIIFNDDTTNVALISEEVDLEMMVAPTGSDRHRLLSLAQVYGSNLPLLSTVERIDITERQRHLPNWLCNAEELAMAGFFTAIYLCEEYVPIRAAYSPCRTCFARASSGKQNRRTTRSTKHFLRGASAFGTCTGSH
jgi:hypothetical protein